MVKKNNKRVRYKITAKRNHGKRRVISDFSTLREAKQELKKLLAPQKTRIVKGKKIKLSSRRQSVSGGGIVNPRIKKVVVSIKY